MQIDVVTLSYIREYECSDGTSRLLFLGKNKEVPIRETGSQPLGAKSQINYCVFFVLYIYLVCFWANIAQH